jgi:hypothetical protein
MVGMWLTDVGPKAPPKGYELDGSEKSGTQDGIHTDPAPHRDDRLESHPHPQPSGGTPGPATYFGLFPKNPSFEAATISRWPAQDGDAEDSKVASLIANRLASVTRFGLWLGRCSARH